MSKLLSNKLSWFVIVYLLIYVSSPLRRVLYIWPDSLFDTYSNGMVIHRWLPMLLLIPLLYMETNHPMAKYWNKLSNIKLVMYSCVVLMTACIFLTFLGIPGVWWSWISVGARLATILLIVIVLKDKLPPGEVVLISISCVVFTIGFWECIYQTANHYIYYSEYPLAQFRHELLVEVPLVATGCSIIGYYIFKYKSRINVTNISLVSLFVGVWILWLSLGYWIDIYFDSTTNSWEYSEYSIMGIFQLSLSKLSKVLLDMLMVSIVWQFNKKGVKVCQT